MDDSQRPRPYPEWRADSASRGEDAAYVFGFDVITHCRSGALAHLAEEASPEARAAAEAAVDHALAALFDLLEGYWRCEAGPGHAVEYALVVRVRDATTRQVVEEVPISPALHDLPIGYWKMRDGEFR
jgi:hypothetical protein